MSYKAETQTLREGLFRFGQSFGYTNIKYSFYRDPLAAFYCKGVVNDAMSKGWDIVDPGTEDKVSWNEEFQKALLKHYPEFLQTIYFSRRDGESLQFLIYDKRELFNFAGTVGQYNIVRDHVGRITNGQFTPKIQGHNGSTMFTLDQHLKNLTVLITERKDNILEGGSVLEQIWDLLFAIYMLVSHSAYFTARAGAGIKDVAIDEGTFTDTESTDIITTLVTNFTNFGSASDTIVRPKTLAGEDVVFDIRTVDSGIDFNTILDMYLTLFSAHTGIPQSTLKGLVPGQLEGAIVNENSYFDFLRDLQEKYTEYCKWFVWQLNRHYAFIPMTEDMEDFDFDLLFRVREVSSEEDDVSLLKSRLENVNLFKTAGVKTIVAFKESGLENIKKGDLKEGVDDPIDLSAGKGEEDKEDSETSEDPKEDTEDDDEVEDDE